MERHLLPLLISLAGIVGVSVTDQDGVAKEVNTVYSLILKVVIVLLAFGWVLAIGLGVVTISKINSIFDKQESVNHEMAILNKNLSERMIAFESQQKSNVKCLDELKNMVYGKGK